MLRTETVSDPARIQHSHIVSEQGAAAIQGHDVTGQAEQIIGHVAHLSVRR